MEESSEGSNQNGEELNSEDIIPDTEESNSRLPSCLVYNYLEFY